MLIDGTVLGDHSVVVALGIDTEGKKQVLGLREDHTEHSRVVKALLRDLVERGLDRNTGATLRDRRREGAHLGHPPKRPESVRFTPRGGPYAHLH